MKICDHASKECGWCFFSRPFDENEHKFDKHCYQRAAYVEAKDIPDQPDTFYMIYVEGGGSPTVKNSTMQQATKEVEGLAKRNSGKKVYLLQALSFCETKYVPTLWTCLRK